MSESAKDARKVGAKDFSLDILRGTAIGAAFIIPGFSGGSVAAILGIYEKLVGAIADIFKDFKRSVLTLLPIFLGMVVGIVGLLFPLGWALEAYPLPTVCLFVGLAIGGLPSLSDKMRGKILPKNVIACLIPFLFALSLSFIPTGSDVNLFELSFGGYALLFLIGMIGSAALVVPGISGSMLLLILGYYNPIVNMITDHFFKGENIGKSILVLGCTALGIAIGFFLISILMKWLLKNFPRGTYFAILGFILGSIPTIYISTAKDAGYTLSSLPTSVLHWGACVLLLAVGFALSLSLVIYSRKRTK